MAKKKTQAEDKALLNYEEALSLLAPHKEGKKLRVHSLEGNGLYMAGCDIDLSEIKKYFKASKHLCLSGPNMRGMGHGVAFFHPKYERYTFLETDKKKLDEFFKQRNIKPGDEY